LVSGSARAHSEWQKVIEGSRRRGGGGGGFVACRSSTGLGHFEKVKRRVETQLSNKDLLLRMKERLEDLADSSAGILFSAAVKPF
jgi:hypothetical protein